MCIFSYLTENDSQNVENKFADEIAIKNDITQ